MLKKILGFINHWQTDCYVLSYPKCGRTWLRFMMGNVLVHHFQLNNVPLNDILMVKNLHKQNPSIPKIRFAHDDLPNWKWINEIETDKSRYKNKKIIFLVRDPRDLVVSNFYQKKYRGFKEKQGFKKENFKGDIAAFLPYEFGGIPNIVTYYNVWSKQKQVPKDFCLVRYEDLKSKPVETLKSIFDFLGFKEIKVESIEHAIAESTFEKMREIEEKNLLNNQRLSAKNNTQEEALKTRKGKVGGYKEELTPKDIEWMEQYLQQNLDAMYSCYL